MAGGPDPAGGGPERDGAARDGPERDSPERAGAARDRVTEHVLERAGADVIVVGHDAWTEPVIDELLAREHAVTVVVTDAGVAERLRERGLAVVETADVDEACFHEAGLADADAVFVATLDEQRNVLALLTAMNVEHSALVATFAREASDVSKLEAAGADRVVSLGEVVADLLVEVALTERTAEDVLDDLTAAAS